LRVDIRCRLGKFSMLSTASVRNAMRRFRRNRRGSAAVEFALVAPVFFALLFAIIESAMVFFAGQVLETGVQDSGRLLYISSERESGAVSSRISATASGALFPCDSLDLCLEREALCAGHRNHPQRSDRTAAEIMSPIASGRIRCPTTPLVVRAFYPWPLFVTGLGYNIANVGRGSTNSSRLLAATAAFRPQ